MPCALAAASWSCCGGHGAKRGERVRPGGRGELHAVLLRFGERPRRQAGNRRAAFADRAGHQASRERRRHQRADGNRPRRFAGDGHPRRISAERGDVLLHPPQRGHLVEQAVVARGVVRRLLRQLRMHEEAEDVRAVVQRHRDDALAGHALAVIPRLGAVAVLESAAEDVDEHRQLLAARLRGRPDVQVEAVLAHAVAAEPVVRVRGEPLHAGGAERVGVAHARPVLHRLRFAPAQVAHGRLREGNPLEAANAVPGRHGGFDHAVRRLHPVGAEGRQRRGSAEDDSGNEQVRGSSHQSLDSGGS